MSSKRDVSSLEYRAALSTCLRWDETRREPYLQLPSFPDLRLTLWREGVEDDLVNMSHWIGWGVSLIKRVGRAVQSPGYRRTTLSPTLPVRPTKLPSRSFLLTCPFDPQPSASPGHTPKNGSPEIIQPTNHSSQTSSLSSKLPFRTIQLTSLQYPTCTS